MAPHAHARILSNIVHEGGGHTNMSEFVTTVAYTTRAFQVSPMCALDMAQWSLARLDQS